MAKWRHDIQHNDIQHNDIMTNRIMTLSAMKLSIRTQPWSLIASCSIYDHQRIVTALRLICKVLVC